MKNKKSNVKKETQNLLRFLYEDENPTGAANAVYVSDGDISGYMTYLTNIYPIDIGTIVVGLSDEQIKDLESKVGRLNLLQIPKEAKEAYPNLPNSVYTTYTSDIDFKEQILSNKIQVINYTPSATAAPNKLSSYLNAAKVFAKAHQGSLIGAGVGAGVTAAGWAAARAYLQRQLKNCETEKCRKDINAKIKKLNRMALLGGIGLTALGAAAQPLGTAFKQGLGGETQQANKQK
jgi:hypothetical protein